MTIEERIAAISSNTRALQDLLNNHSTTAREQTASLLAEVYGAGLFAKQPGHEDELVKAMNARRLLAPKPEENAWGKLIRTCCGDWHREANGQPVVHADGTRTWVSNRSLDKYARVLRHAEERGVTQDRFVSFVLGYSDDRHGRMLDGIIKADKEKYPAVTRGLSPEKLSLANSVAQTNVQASVELTSTAGKVDREFVCAFGYVENGQFHIIDLMADSQKAAVLAAAKKRGSQ